MAFTDYHEITCKELVGMLTDQDLHHALVDVENLQTSVPVFRYKVMAAQIDIESCIDITFQADVFVWELRHGITSNLNLSETMFLR